mgnify:CR=1 FL=1
MLHFGRINMILSRTGRCHNTVGGYPPLQGVILLYLGAARSYITDASYPPLQGVILLYPLS